MKTTRRKYSAAFKAQVAIEAIKEQETLSELARLFDLHPQVISNWKREFLSRGAEIFSTKAPDEEAAKNIFSKWLRKVCSPNELNLPN